MNFLHQLKALLKSSKHSERKTIDLQYAESVDVVLIPLDNRPTRHGGVFNGNQLMQRTVGNYKPPTC